MFKQYLYLVSTLLVLSLIECAPPEGINKCKSDDSKCHTESAKMFQSIVVSGIPEYGVELLDPLTIKSINASNGNLLFLLSDVTVKGLKNCDIHEVSRDRTKSTITLKMQCTSTLDGDYVLKGSVLLLAVEGKGKIHVDLRSAVFHVDMNIVEKTGEDGKKHWSIKSFQHTLELKEKSDVVFGDLFKGNAVLGQAADELIRNNGNDVILEIGNPVFEFVIGRVVKNFKRMFNAVPIEDLSID